LSEPGECEPIAARLIFYDNDDYFRALKNHYQQYPQDKGTTFILLLPKNSTLFRKANYENHPRRRRNKTA
jgi:hypothetical protein